MIDLYSWDTPNGHRASIMLEETQLAYRMIPIDLSKGQQFESGFLQVSPNNKIPAIVDQEAKGGPISIFESGAILIYLAEKAQMLLPGTEPDRSATFQWLFWASSGLAAGMGRFLSTINANPLDNGANQKYLDEALRLLRVMDIQLAQRTYLADTYSVADISAYPWVRLVHRPLERALGDKMPPLSNVDRWLREVGARPAVRLGSRIPMQHVGGPSGELVADKSKR